MQKIMMAAAALVGMGGVAHAQSAATVAINLTAKVDHYCTIDGAGPGGAQRN